MARSLLIIYLVATLALPAQAGPEARVGDRLARREFGGSAQEFFANGQAGELLVPIKVIGAVRVAGIYHVPKKTDLGTLLALAGGATPNASNEVLIRRRAGAKESVTTIDLNHALETADASLPFLETDDIVVVKAKEPIVSQDALTLVGLIASLVSLLVSGLVLSQAVKK